MFHNVIVICPSYIFVTPVFEMLLISDWMTEMFDLHYQRVKSRQPLIEQKRHDDNAPDPNPPTTSQDHRKHIRGSLDSNRNCVVCALGERVGCSLDANYILRLDSHWMFIGCVLEAHWMLIGYLFVAHSIFIRFLLNAHWMHTGCSLHANWMLI